MTVDANCRRCGEPRGRVSVLIPYRGERICDRCVIEMNLEVLRDFARDEEMAPLDSEISEEHDDMSEIDDDFEVEAEEDIMAWSPLYPVDDDLLDRMTKRINDGEKIEWKDLSAEQIDPDAVALIPKAVAEQFCLIPIRKSGRKLLVAFSDPTDEEAVHEVQYFAGMDVNVVAADEDDIEAAIRKYYEV